MCGERPKVLARFRRSFVRDSCAQSNTEPLRSRWKSNEAMVATAGNEFSEQAGHSPGKSPRNGLLEHQANEASIFRAEALRRRGSQQKVSIWLRPIRLSLTTSTIQNWQT